MPQLIQEITIYINTSITGLSLMNGLSLIKADLSFYNKAIKLYLRAFSKLIGGDSLCILS
jgi:hypothetical protein